MEALLIAVLAIVAIALAATVAPKLNIAGPLILVVIGLGVSLLPFVDVPEIDPEIILVGILPPLLYSAAISLPAIEFRRDFGPIAGLSVLLVVISAGALGFFFALVVPGLGLALGFALGAILSPTDAVATGIVKKLGISRRVVTLLEGESLLNDATALVILRTAVAAFIAGSATFGGAVGTFAWGVVVAIVVGTIVGYLNLRLRMWIRHQAASTAVGLVMPFVAYVPTEQLGGSGLVAAVVTGIVTGQGSVRWFTPEQRLSDSLNWHTIELVLEGAVFLIMGLELKEIVQQNTEGRSGLWHALWLAAAALGIVLVARTAYVALLVWLQSRRAREKQRERLESIGEQLDDLGANAMRHPPRHRRSPERMEKHATSLRARITRGLADLDYYQASPLGWRHGTIIVWAGMRGVVTLAAAQTLPRDTPERPLLILVAFIVAVGSLMLQGFTLPWLVRILGLSGRGQAGANRAEQERLDDELRDAAASVLRTNGLRRRDGSAFPDDLIETVGARYLQPPDDIESAVVRDRLELRLVLIATMRARLAEVSSGGQYSTAALRHSLAELDAEELSLQLRLGDE